MNLRKLNEWNKPVTKDKYCMTLLIGGTLEYWFMDTGCRMVCTKLLERGVVV